MTEPIPPITLPPSQNPEQEGQWLQQGLNRWLDEEFLPEVANKKNCRTCISNLCTAANGGGK